MPIEREPRNPVPPSSDPAAPIRISVFVGVSVDGFLARPDGRLDFLPPEPEEHGYTAFIASVDVLVIGRKTYETVLAFGEWAYPGKTVVVLSSRPVEPPPFPGALVERMEGDPRGIRDALAARGFRHVYVDGGITIQRFLRAGLIQRMTITRVPILIGDGIPLFGSLPKDVRLEHVETRSYPSGLVTTAYEVLS